MTSKHELWGAVRDDFRRYTQATPTVFRVLLALVQHPGLSAATWQRISALAFTKGKAGRVVGLLIWRKLVRSHACYLSPKATLGTGMFLPHPTAVVIGEGVRVGRNVTIYQSVTLGTKNGDGYPSIDDDVVIYAGSVVVGKVRVGKGARVGANSFVMHDVPPNTTVAGAPAKEVGRKTPTKTDR